MPEFIPGLELSEKFYQREVEPILRTTFPGLLYSAALIGWGSEVLGFDTAISRDHHWGPRVLLFLSEADYPKLNRRISKVLSRSLPYEFLGYSTNFSKPEPNGVRFPVTIKSGPVNHMVNVYTVRSFVRSRLGIDPAQKTSVKEWLTLSQQRLLEFTSGQVYHDGLGELGKMRRKLSYYPKDVWLYLLASQWTRISQEEAFVGRNGDVGDELGSQLVAARLVREIMVLSFLMERRYIPYSKWLGPAFNNLKIAKELKPLLSATLKATTWKQRERWLGKAYTVVAQRHNALKVTTPLSTKTAHYHSRAYVVINADRFAKAIKQSIRDAEVKRIGPEIGAIDQFTDSTNVIEDLRIGMKLRRLYE